jgi:hypothetical protein
MTYFSFTGILYAYELGSQDIVQFFLNFRPLNLFTGTDLLPSSTHQAAPGG